MAIKIGTQDLKELYIGNTSIKEIYLGVDKVWEKTTSTDLMLFVDGIWGDTAHYLGTIYAPPSPSAPIYSDIQWLDDSTYVDVSHQSINTSNDIGYCGSYAFGPIDFSRYSALEIIINDSENISWDSTAHLSTKIQFINTYDYTDTRRSKYDCILTDGIEIPETFIKTTFVQPILAPANAQYLRIISPNSSISSIILKK